MLEFQLFRIKVYFPLQFSLFEGQQRSISEAIKGAISSKPQKEIWRRGQSWHIGNILPIDETSLYFRFGKKTKSILEVYQNGAFKDEEFETAPYTHVIVDSKLELCGIAKKTKLSQKTSTIAKQLERFLNASEYALYKKIQFNIVEINDPEPLIGYIKNEKYNIIKFSMTFSKPNPWDVNEDFIKPLERLLSAAQGEKGKTELEGENLNPNVLEELTRSIASTGNEVVVNLKDELGVRVRRKLTGNPVIIRYREDLVGKKQLKYLLKRMKDTYNKIRKKENKC